MTKFTEQQINESRAKVKTGADFPREIQEFKAMGILSYEFLLETGTCVYYGNKDYSLATPSDYKHFPFDNLRISKDVSAQKLRDAITIHQKGMTDFPTFCVQAVRAGVFKWKCDLQKMLCTYFDAKGNEMVSEPIPDTAKY